MKKRYLGNLDLIKALAAVGIVFHHYQQISSVRLGGAIEFYGGRFVFGYLVELFFIISGFLTEYTCQEKAVFRFWITGKIKRLFPYAFLACVFSLLTAAVYFYLTGQQLFGMSYSLPVILTSLFLVHTGWIREFSPAVNNPTWYLCILILCYLLYWMVKKGILSRHIESCVFVLLALLAVPAYYAVTHGVSDIPFFRINNIRGYGSFLTGCALCRFWQRHTERTVFIADFALWVMTAAGFLLLGLSSWYVLTYLFFPAIILSALLLPQLESKAVKTAGAVSFEVYLWHVPLYGLFLTGFTVKGFEIKHSYLTMFLFTALVCLWAAGIYALIEKPLTKRLMNRQKRII